jgi:hypothetical protein
MSGPLMPSLENILKLCYVLDITPLQLMTGNSSTLEEAMKARDTSRLSRPKRFALQPKKQVNSLEYLQAVIDGREAPHSVRWIERYLGLGRDSLKNHHPEEKEVVCALHRAYLAERSRKRKEQIENEVTTATYKLHAQGIFPSELKVLMLTPKWLIPLFGDQVVNSRKSATLVSQIVRRGGKGCQVPHCFPYHTVNPFVIESP